MNARHEIPIDTLELYRWAVQDPETHAAVLQAIYERARGGRSATVLREDFAGTSAESVAWIAIDTDRRAIAVERDTATVAWAAARAERILEEAVPQLQIVCGDVMEVAPPHVPAADILSVLNFSVGYFTERRALLRYFEHARCCLAPDGVLVVNAFGGAEAMRSKIAQHRITPVSKLESEHEIAPFDYEWEQRSYDAVSGIVDCRIHFRVGDERRGDPVREVRDAFEYRFRLWGLSELAELMLDAGFGAVQVWQHTYDASKGEAGVFLGPVAAIEQGEKWLAYVVALR